MNTYITSVSAILASSVAATFPGKEVPGMAHIHGADLLLMIPNAYLALFMVDSLMPSFSRILCKSRKSLQPSANSLISII